MNASKKIRTIAALGTLSGAVWAGTFATFTDTQASSSTFATGTLDLALADSDGGAVFNTLSVSNLKPGQVQYATLTVSNAGTLGYSYTMASTESAPSAGKPDLAAQLRLIAVKGATTCDGTAFAEVSGVVSGAAGTETVIAEGTLAAAGIPTARTLAAGTSEVLCFRVALPTGTDNTYQGLTATSTLTFNATQV